MIDSIPHCPIDICSSKPLGQCGILSMINTPFVFSIKKHSHISWFLSLLKSLKKHTLIWKDFFFYLV